MSSTLVMFDSASPATLPPWDGQSVYAGYVDGYADFPAIRAMFPQARVMSITGQGGIAECADIERGMMSDADAPGWYRAARARGVAMPKLYREASAAGGLIRVMAEAGISRAGFRLWSAHYESQAHICGSQTCGYPQADGTQWTSSAMGRNLDQSLLFPDFFSVPVTVPPRTQEVDVQLPVLGIGDSGQQVRNWQGLLIAHGYGYMIAPVPGTSVEDKSGVDGVYGAKTAAATEAFQAAKGIRAAGVDGPTWVAALG